MWYEIYNKFVFWLQIFKKLKEVLPGAPQVQTFVADFAKGI